MRYTPPVAEQRFLLDHVVGIAELAAAGRFAAATPDMVDAILEGAGQFAAGIFAPLNRVGDEVGARWAEGKIVSPPGFAEAYRAYVEGGWGTLNAPEAFGGQGLPFALATAVLEDLGSANMAFSLLMMLTPGAVEALLAHGSAEQRAAWLPRLVSGDHSGTMNLTEPQAGSDVGALRTLATPAGDGSYRIKGGKIFITWGEQELTENIVHLVLARTPDAPTGSRGISLFLVPKIRPDGTANDVRCTAIEHKLGIHAAPTCTMAFGDHDDCHGWLIGEEQGGLRAMFTMMNNARLNVGLQGVSIAERATQAAVDYARERVQSARAGAASRNPVPIVKHPDVRRMIVRMKALTQAARALVYYAAGQVDRAHLGDAAARARLDLLTPLAKAYATDVGCEVASLCIQVHGGMGYVEETGVAQFFRDARIAPIYEGTNGIQAADLVGRKLGQDEGAVFAALLADMRADSTGEPALAALLDDVEAAASFFVSAGIDDALAGSTPFLTMLAVAVAGWQMARQARIVGDADTPFLAMKRAAARFYLDRIVPEASGLSAGAVAGAAGLYDVEDDALAL